MGKTVTTTTTITTSDCGGCGGTKQAATTNGLVVPDIATIRAALQGLRQRMASDPELKKRFEADPGRVLGELGLNSDIQQEIMEETGIEVPEGRGCTYTCTCTEACCVTGW